MMTATAGTTTVVMATGSKVVMVVTLRMPTTKMATMIATMISTMTLATSRVAAMATTMNRMLDSVISCFI